VAGSIKGALQKRALVPLNIIYPGGEYETNLIMVNVETLSHDDSNSALTLTFLQMVMSLGKGVI